jgi:hypothetical protein
MSILGKVMLAQRKAGELECEKDLMRKGLVTKFVTYPGQLVQLHPEKTKNPMFAGAFMVVTEPKAFGAQGYVQGLGENGNPGDVAYYRADFEEMFPVGKAEWILP